MLFLTACYTGEAALQAYRGSAFGFGTDAGGSVSMPASYQGVFRINPSSGHITFSDGVQIVSVT